MEDQSFEEWEGKGGIAGISTSFGVVDGFCATGAERGVVGVGAEVVAVTPTALAFFAGRGLDFDVPVGSRL
jgi:hypothetical protein